jgi:hypothetical protein
MRSKMKILMLPAILAFFNCNHIETTQPSGKTGDSNKPPLVFDESTILHPPGTAMPKALGKTASTYYSYSIGNGLTQADLNKACYASGGWPNDCLLYPVWVNGVLKNIITAPYGAFSENTYSGNFSSNPENLWVSNGAWLQSGVLLDNEQAEQHYTVTDHTWPNNSFSQYHISLDYEVSSESNFDYLWINSTSTSSCNNPGQVHKYVSGQQSGSVSFYVPRSCGTIWLGIYYIKDYSVSSNGDYARIKNLKIEPAYPVSP